MKRTLIFVLTMTTLLAFATASAWADGNTDSADFDIFAFLLKPISIDNQTPLSFGKIVKFEGAACWITVHPDGTIESSDPARCMPVKEHYAAYFNVTCETMFPFVLDLPDHVTLHKIGGDATDPNQQLLVDSFVAKFPYGDLLYDGDTRLCDEIDGGFDGNMQDPFSLGGSLHIDENDMTGKYQGTGTVFVTYM